MFNVQVLSCVWGPGFTPIRDSYCRAPRMQSNMLDFMKIWKSCLKVIQRTLRFGKNWLRYSSFSVIWRVKWSVTKFPRVFFWWSFAKFCAHFGRHPSGACIPIKLQCRTIIFKFRIRKVPKNFSSENDFIEKCSSKNARLRSRRVSWFFARLVSIQSRTNRFLHSVSVAVTIRGKRFEVSGQ